MTTPPTPNRPEPTRRQFLAGAAGAAVAATTPVATASPRKVRARSAETLKVGLIGCGGRGTGAAANALRADPNTELVALGDSFADHLERSLSTLRRDFGEQVVVDDDHKFVGFNAYKGVIDTCDVILFATSPHFRPQHVAYAVEKGRHMFVEKPVAVDAPGLRAIWDSCRAAEKKRLSVVSGLCYRYDFAKVETFKRLHDGAIGDITALQCTYNTGELWHRGRQPEWSEMEFQMRNWLYFTWLSGDHIAEQHIHSIDKILWAMGDEAPVKCVSSGGRIKRTDAKYGNVYDHFNTTFEWKNGVRGFSSCRQWNGAASDVSDHAFGTNGVARLQRHRIEGKNKWRYRSDQPNNMYQNEHDALFRAIRADKPINNGDYMCKATMMAIMGRMAAYTGKAVTWDEAMNSQLDLTPPKYEWGDLAVAPVAIPGVTQFT